MDFSDTQEEACFRQEVRSWLQANGTALRSTSPDELYTEADIASVASGRRKSRSWLCAYSMAQGIWGHGW